MVDRLHHLCDLRFPATAYRPGRTPHPHRDAESDADSRVCWPPEKTPLEPAAYRRAILAGLDLFNHGYFWEAHEAWEEPWQRESDDSSRRLYLQALIRMAAAALKLAVDEPRGVKVHAGWCADTFRRLAQRTPEVFADGPPAAELVALCERLAVGEEPLEDGVPERLATVLSLS